MDGVKVIIAQKDRIISLDASSSDLKVANLVESFRNLGKIFETAFSEEVSSRQYSLGDSLNKNSISASSIYYSSEHCECCEHY